MKMSMMRKVMMDIAVPQMTGGPLATSVEQCVCPPQFSGLSCQQCAPDHVKQGDQCVPVSDGQASQQEPVPYNPRVIPMGYPSQPPESHIPNSRDRSQNRYPPSYNNNQEQNEMKGYPRPQEPMKGYPRPVEPMKGYPQPSVDPMNGYERSAPPPQTHHRYTSDPYLMRARPEHNHYQERSRPAPNAGCPSVTVTISPPEQTIPQGGSTVIRCSGGQPGDVYSWEKIGGDMSSPALSVSQDTITIRFQMIFN